MNVSVTIEKMAKLAVSKSLLKEFSKNGERIVYLNNGDEFQINLFNNYNYTIGADISIDGKSIGGRFIIKPGERVWLERYLDKPSKFKFSTYEVEANNSIVEHAIRNNGKIVIKFYKETESTEKKIYNAIKYPCAVLNNGSNTGDCYDYNRLSTIGNTYNDDTLCSCNLNNSTSCDDHLISSASINLNNTNYNHENSLFTCNSVKTKETGRVEAGSHSKQEFRNVNMEFETWDFCTEIIRILPASEKQYNANDLKKVYCTNCGRKINPKFKFCPYCGQKCI